MNKGYLYSVFSKLKNHLPEVWDGKEAILYMKEHGCSNWRQMEWPGWYFQFMCEKILSNTNLMEIPGPKYGNVEFDGFRVIPWDFKAHAIQSGDSVPTNGYYEVSMALEDFGQVGFIIANGYALYDDERESFKKWHDSIKGRTSNYVIDRIDRGAPSRRRKTHFKLDNIMFIILSKDTLSECGSFQGGMRNANGVARNPKVLLKLNNENIEKYTYYISEEE